MARQYFVGGNFKMNGSKEQITQILKNSTSADLNKNTEVVVGVPAPYLDLASNLTKGSKVEVSAENCYLKDSGAFTGEISPSMIKDNGADWVIIGHSERRHIFKEDDALVSAKAKFALEKGLKVIYCIGELKEEREAGKTMDVNSHQLGALSKVLKPEDWKNVVIAYEPVWAIGTGLTATPEDARDVHRHLRAYLKNEVSPEVSANTRIIYGGSVTHTNCDALGEDEDVDGFLVGGASLKPEFVRIVNTKSFC